MRVAFIGSGGGLHARADSVQWLEALMSVGFIGLGGGPR